MNRDRARRAKVSDAEVERVLALTLESLPRDATHWSTRSLTPPRQCGLEPWHGLEPHLESVCLATASQRDVQAVQRPVVH